MPKHLRIAHLHWRCSHSPPQAPEPVPASPVPGSSRAVGPGLAALSWPLLCCSAHMGSNGAGTSLQKQMSACMCETGKSSVSSSRGVSVNVE